MAFEINTSLHVDMLADPDELAASMRRQAEYQALPLPLFADVPHTKIRPTFNPTNAAEEEIYSRGRYPRVTATYFRSHSEFDPDRQSMDMWRLVDRARLVDGLGLVASRIVVGNTVGDVEGFDPVKHLASNHDMRAISTEAATPFVSFTTDPEYMASSLILSKGFGIKQGRDSVVVHAQVHPSRIISNGKNRQHEVLLVGGVAPDEYLAAYEVPAFVDKLVPEDDMIKVRGSLYTRDQALAYWN